MRSNTADILAARHDGSSATSGATSGVSTGTSDPSLSMANVLEKSVEAHADKEEAINLPRF